MNSEIFSDRSTAMPPSVLHAGALDMMLHRFFPDHFFAPPVRPAQPMPPPAAANAARAATMAATSLRLAARIFGNISEQKVLFVGAGPMIEVCTTQFCAEAPQRVTVANRTLERARRLAWRIRGEAITLAELPEQLPLHDVVITSTASPLPIIGKGMVERAIRARKHRPILMIDLAATPDVEPEVAELDDVFLYTVDDLARMG